VISSEQRRSVCIIGAGAVGSTLAVLFKRSGYRIISVISHGRASARKLARQVGCACTSDTLSRVPSSVRMILIAAPDDRIPEIAGELARRTDLQFRRLIAFHASGVLTSDALLPLRRKGARAFSFHPIQTFPPTANLKDRLARTRSIAYGFEGPARDARIARAIAGDIGGTIIRISKKRKILYHIACVVASNYSVALLGMTEDLLRLVGGDIRLRHLLPLIETSIANAIRLSPEKALTGPMARGSITTIRSHVRELLKTDKRLARLYCQYGMQALHLAVRRRKLSPDTVRKIERILAIK
jgi:predicted short-subunit dehydrogenase-like oxidoreductase (DUF2520 family)